MKDRAARPGAAPPGGRAARVLDLAFAIRPLLWIPAIALFEAGRTMWGSGGAGGADAAPRAPLPGGAAALPLLSLLAILGAVHLWNGWRDRRSDRWNRKGGAIVAGTLGGGAVAATGLAALVAAAAAAFARDVAPASRLLLAAAAGLGLVYTTPPLETKRRAGFDLATQATGYGIVAFLLGASASGGIGPLAPALAAAIPYACGIVSVGALTMIADRRGDEEAGARTTAVTFGEARTRDTAIAAAIAAAVSGLALHDAAPGVWGLAAATWIALAPRSDALADGRRAGDGRGAIETAPPASWIRDAVALQILFALLLLPRSPLPLLATALLGLAAAWRHRAARGRAYPLDVFMAGSRDEM